MKFKMEIELGNAAMLTPADVSEALREAAKKLDGVEPALIGGGLTGAIRDINGNTVGTWKFTGKR